MIFQKDSSPHRWFSVTVAFEQPFEEDSWEFFVHLALEQGAQGCSEKDQGGDFFFSTEFTSEEEAKALLWNLAETLRLPTPILNLYPVNPKEWISRAAEHYHARVVSKRIAVGPVEERELFLSNLKSEQSTVHYIAVEFGEAFGTGTHPTTVLCLQFLELFPQPFKKVLDFGSGTGVLAFAGLKLGAEEVVCIDCSISAEEIHHRNAVENGLAEKCHFLLSDSPTAAEKFGKFDLILCNMLLAEVEPHLPELARFGCPVIYSGILEDQLPEAISLFVAQGLVCSEQAFLEEWAGILFHPFHQIAT